jgi:predicted ArsR family transcriptional regulator
MRRDVEKQFGVGKKQAKRELAALTAAGLVRFVARSRPRHCEPTEAGAADRR